MGAQAAQGEGTPGQADPSKFSGKKSKAVAKQGGGNTQWAILKLSGIPESEIPSFRCLFLLRCPGGNTKAQALLKPDRGA